MFEAITPVAGVETVPPGEQEQIQEIAELMVKLLEQRYSAAKPFLRGVHPKAHGCAHATFTVNANLPEDLRVGVFAKPGATYEAVVRFSNAAALVGPDVQDSVDSNSVKKRSHGSRGMAIKIRAVPGTSLAKDEPGTQDFLMVNFPVFPFANVEDYLELTRAQLEHHDLPPTFPAFADKLKNTGRAQRAGVAGQISFAIQQIPMVDPVSSRYFSAAPFLFGSDRVMKFGVTPTFSTPATPLPDKLDDHYLRAALAKRLREDDASFDFAVQVRPPSKEAEIEDVTKEWKEADFKFQSVATVSIPKQEIDSGEPGSDCESLFFTPWHTLPEHRPIGGINRLRLAAYQASIERRRK